MVSASSRGGALSGSGGVILQESPGFSDGALSPLYPSRGGLATRGLRGFSHLGPPPASHARPAPVPYTQPFPMPDLNALSHSLLHGSARVAHTHPAPLLRPAPHVVPRAHTVPHRATTPNRPFSTRAPQPLHAPDLGAHNPSSWPLQPDTFTSPSVDNMGPSGATAAPCSAAASPAGSVYFPVHAASPCSPFGRAPFMSAPYKFPHCPDGSLVGAALHSGGASASQSGEPPEPTGSTDAQGLAPLASGLVPRARLAQGPAAGLNARPAARNNAPRPSRAHTGSAEIVGPAAPPDPRHVHQPERAAEHFPPCLVSSPSRVQTPNDPRSCATTGMAAGPGGSAPHAMQHAMQPDLMPPNHQQQVAHSPGMRRVYGANGRLGGVAANSTCRSFVNDMHHNDMHHNAVPEQGALAEPPAGDHEAWRGRGGGWRHDARAQGSLLGSNIGDGGRSESNEGFALTEPRPTHTHRPATAGHCLTEGAAVSAADPAMLPRLRQLSSQDAGGENTLLSDDDTIEMGRAGCSEAALVGASTGSPLHTRKASERNAGRRQRKRAAKEWPADAANAARSGTAAAGATEGSPAERHAGQHLGSVDAKPSGGHKGAAAAARFRRNDEEAEDRPAAFHSADGRAGSNNGDGGEDCALRRHAAVIEQEQSQLANISQDDAMQVALSDSEVSNIAPSPATRGTLHMAGSAMHLLRPGAAPAPASAAPGDVPQPAHEPVGSSYAGEKAPCARGAGTKIAAEPQPAACTVPLQPPNSSHLAHDAFHSPLELQQGGERPDGGAQRAQQRGSPPDAGAASCEGCRGEESDDDEVQMRSHEAPAGVDGGGAQERDSNWVRRADAMIIDAEGDGGEAEEGPPGGAADRHHGAADHHHHHHHHHHHVEQDVLVESHPALPGAERADAVIREEGPDDAGEEVNAVAFSDASDERPPCDSSAAPPLGGLGAKVQVAAAVSTSQVAADAHAFRGSDPIATAAVSAADAVAKKGSGSSGAAADDDDAVAHRARPRMGVSGTGEGLRAESAVEDVSGGERHREGAQSAVASAQLRQGHASGRAHARERHDHEGHEHVRTWLHDHVSFAASERSGSGPREEGAGEASADGETGCEQEGSVDVLGMVLANPIAREGADEHPSAVAATSSVRDERGENNVLLGDLAAARSRESQDEVAGITAAGAAHDCASTRAAVSAAAAVHALLAAAGEPSLAPFVYPPAGVQGGSAAHSCIGGAEDAGTPGGSILNGHAASKSLELLNALSTSLMPQPSVPPFASDGARASSPTFRTNAPTSAAAAVRPQTCAPLSNAPVSGQPLHAHFHHGKRPRPQHGGGPYSGLESALDANEGRPPKSQRMGNGPQQGQRRGPNFSSPLPPLRPPLGMFAFDGSAPSTVPMQLLHSEAAARAGPPPQWMQAYSQQHQQQPQHPGAEHARVAASTASAVPCSVATLLGCSGHAANQQGSLAMPLEQPLYSVQQQQQSRPLRGAGEGHDRGAASLPASTVPESSFLSALGSQAPHSMLLLPFLAAQHRMRQQPGPQSPQDPSQQQSQQQQQDSNAQLQQQQQQQRASAAWSGPSRPDERMNLDIMSTPAAELLLNNGAYSAPCDAHRTASMSSQHAVHREGRTPRPDMAPVPGLSLPLFNVTQAMLSSGAGGSGGSGAHPIVQARILLHRAAELLQQQQQMHDPWASGANAGARDAAASAEVLRLALLQELAASSAVPNGGGADPMRLPQSRAVAAAAIPSSSSAPEGVASRDPQQQQPPQQSHRSP